ncbi:hypothetical protein ACHAXH_005962, partial [Discostella pseudostelligera]
MITRQSTLPAFAIVTATSSILNNGNRLRPALMTSSPLLLRNKYPTITSNPYHPHRRLYQFTTSNSEFDKDYSKYSTASSSEEDTDAKSQFGTKVYWDAMYDGMGDFAAEEYSWYYGYEVIRPYLQEYGEELFSLLNDVTSGKVEDEAAVATTTMTSRHKSQLSILLPGCGNDPLLLDLFNDGYRKLTAFDYSLGAIGRQRELLEYLPATSEKSDIELRVEDARALPTEWTNAFDIIIEKGALDAIYLSGNDERNLEKAIVEFERVLRPGGICISCSGVVPEQLRRETFRTTEWVWLRDGSDDLRA